MIHIRWQVQVRDAWTNPVKFNRMLVGNERVFLSVQEKYWALSTRYQVNIAEAFIDNDGEEAGPAEQTLCCIFNRHVG